MSLLADENFTAAEPLLRAALEHTLAQDNLTTFSWMQRLAQCLIGQQKFKEAETIAQKAVEGFGRHGPEDEDVLETRYLQVEILRGQRKSADAREIAEPLLAALEKNSHRGPDHITTLKCRSLLAILLKETHKNAEGKELAARNLESLQAIIKKAESTESSGSRRLSLGEAAALVKAEEMALEVINGQKAAHDEDEDFEQNGRASSKLSVRLASKGMAAAAAGGSRAGSKQSNGSRAGSKHSVA